MTEQQQDSAQRAAAHTVHHSSNTNACARTPLQLALRLPDLAAACQHRVLHPLKQLLGAVAESQQREAPRHVHAIAGADAEHAALRGGQQGQAPQVGKRLCVMSLTVAPRAAAIMQAAAAAAATMQRAVRCGLCAHLPMHSPCSSGSGSGSREAARRALRRSAACSGCRRCGPSVTMDPSEQKMVVTGSLCASGAPSRPEAPLLRSNSGEESSPSPPHGLLPPAHQRAPPAPRAPCSRVRAAAVICKLGGVQIASSCSRRPGGQVQRPAGAAAHRDAKGRASGRCSPLPAPACRARRWQPRGEGCSRCNEHRQLLGSAGGGGRSWRACRCMYAVITSSHSRTDSRGVRSIGCMKETCQQCSDASPRGARSASLFATSATSNMADVEQQQQQPEQAAPEQAAPDAVPPAAPEQPEEQQAAAPEETAAPEAGEPAVDPAAAAAAAAAKAQAIAARLLAGVSRSCTRTNTLEHPHPCCLGEAGQLPVRHPNFGWPLPTPLNLPLLPQGGAENGNNKRPRDDEDDALQGPSKRSTGALEGGADPPGANPAGVSYRTRQAARQGGSTHRGATAGGWLAPSKGRSRRRRPNPWPGGNALCPVRAAGPHGDPAHPHQPGGQADRQVGRDDSQPAAVHRHAHPGAARRSCPRCFGAACSRIRASRVAAGCAGAATLVPGWCGGRGAAH